jgi:hypothetical protein
MKEGGMKQGIAGVEVALISGGRSAVDSIVARASGNPEIEMYLSL